MNTEVSLDLSGYLTLEGRFLESLWAASLLADGANVVERDSTAGYHHDVLVRGYGESIFYECTGQAKITGKKIDKFLADAIRLGEELPRNLQTFR